MFVWKISYWKSAIFKCYSVRRKKNTKKWVVFWPWLFYLSTDLHQKNFARRLNQLCILKTPQLFDRFYTLQSIEVFANISENAIWSRFRSIVWWYAHPTSGSALDECLEYREISRKPNRQLFWVGNYIDGSSLYSMMVYTPDIRFGARWMSRIPRYFSKAKP